MSEALSVAPRQGSLYGEYERQEFARGASGASPSSPRGPSVSTGGGGPPISPEGTGSPSNPSGPIPAITGMDLRDLMEKVILWMENNKNPVAVSTLVAFMAMSAVSSKHGNGYLIHSSSSIVSAPFWDWDGDAIFGAGVLGCVVLSGGTEILPDQLIVFRNLWITENGGYDDVIKAYKLVKNPVNSNLSVQMMKATEVFADQSVISRFQECISKNSGMFVYKNHRPSAGHRIKSVLISPLIRVAAKSVRALRNHSQEFISMIAEGVRSFILVPVAALLLLAQFTKEPGQGLFTTALFITIRAVLWVTCFCFGKYSVILISIAVIAILLLVMDETSEAEGEDRAEVYLSVLRSASDAIKGMDEASSSRKAREDMMNLGVDETGFEDNSTLVSTEIVPTAGTGNRTSRRNRRRGDLAARRNTSASAKSTQSVPNRRFSRDNLL